jgi:hypothetical protein
MIAKSFRNLPSLIMGGTARHFANMARLYANMLATIKFLFIKKIKGNHLFILGHKRSGKTTLCRWLLGKEYLAICFGTWRWRTWRNTTKNTKEFSEELQRELGFNITVATDVFSAKKQTEINLYHKKIFEESNSIILYMINSYRFNKSYSQEQRKCVIDELGALGRLGKNMNKRILCILTHIDELDGFEESHIGKQELINRYFDPNIIQNFKNENLPLDFIFVSLKKCRRFLWEEEGYMKESLEVILMELSKIR